MHENYIDDLHVDLPAKQEIAKSLVCVHRPAVDVSATA